MLELERYITSNQLPKGLNELLMSWCLGFAFTGFKLIEQSFTKLFGILCENQ